MFTVKCAVPFHNHVSMLVLLSSCCLLFRLPVNLMPETGDCGTPQLFLYRLHTLLLMGG